MEKQYHAIDIMKFICSIMVIVVHTLVLLPYSTFGNFVVTNIFGRFVVPFFFISTSFFVSMKSRSNPTYFRKYIIALTKLYLFWSILYIPCGFVWIQQNLDIPFYLYPIALVLGFFYLGTYYHLWYVPALIFSLIVVEWYTKRFRLRTLIPIAFVLFCIGSLETYYGVVNIPIVQSVIDKYMMVFFTTRNGLFFGLFFVACGYYLSKSDRLLHIEHKRRWLVVSLILLVIEAYVLDQTNTLNFNFLIMLAPCTILLFLCLRDINVSWNLNYSKLREFSEYYYFTHAFFLVIIPEGLALVNHRELYDNNGFFRFITVMLCTHILTCIIYSNKQKKKKLGVG